MTWNGHRLENIIPLFNSVENVNHVNSQIRGAVCVCFCVLWGLFPTPAHLCTAWVGETTRPESALEQKVLNLALVLAVWSRLLVWKTEKTTSLTDITGWSVGGPRTQNNDDWPGLTLQVSNCGLHRWFSRLFCVPLFILMLEKHWQDKQLFFSLQN